MTKSLSLVAVLLLIVLSAWFNSPRAAASPRQSAQGSRDIKLGRTPAPPKKAATTPVNKAPRTATPPGGPRLVVQLGQRTMQYGFAAFSSDSRLGATGGGGDVVVWDVATGREVRRFTGNEGDPGAQDLDGLMGGAFSPDNRLLAVAVGPNLRLWNVATGKLVWQRTNEAHAFLKLESAYAPIAFMPDGRQIVVRGDNAKLTWDATTGRLVARARLNKKGVEDGVTEDEMLARQMTTPDGKFVVEAKDGVVSVWVKATGAQSGVVRFKDVTGDEETGDGLLAFALSPDGRLLITANKVDDERESIRLWDARTGEALHTLAGRPPGDAATFRFTAEGGLLGVTAQGETIRAREMLGGHAVEWKVGGEPSWMEVSPDGRYIVAAVGRVGQVWDARTGAQLARVEAELKDGEKAEEFSWDFAGFTPDETVTFREESALEGDLGQTVRLSLADWKERRVNGLGQMPYTRGAESSEKGFVLSADARAAAWEAISSSDGDEVNRHFVTVWNADPKTKNKTFEVDRDEAYGDASGLALSPDGRKIIVVTSNAGGNLPQANIKIWDADAKRALYKLKAPGFRVGETVAWSPDGRTLATGADAGTIIMWDAATGKELKRLTGRLASVSKVEFSPDSRYLMASAGDGTRLLLDVATGAEVCRLITFADGGWIVVDPQGRFDSDDLADIRGVHWIAPDDPTRPLPLEIFMRDYYEPRLLARILSGEKFAPVRAFAELNRQQPRVAITSIEQRPDRPELVNVTVEVAQATGEARQGAQTVERAAGVYDLRLFRDGQLVGHAPDADGEVITDARTGRATITFKEIRLPRRADLKEVEFTAYAFNEDRIKSETAQRTFNLPGALKAAQGRAYIVSVGVNAYENARWDLRFAANDARRLQETVADSVAGAGDYAEIVRVPLISDYELKDGKKSAPRIVTESSATKANFKAVLDLLAGKTVDAETLRRIPNAAEIRQATPEDLVIISFSSHGYADERGNFYLLPYDTGAGAEMRDVLTRAISSDEMSLWLREVDAGEMVLVVDACHSAASVQGDGFKPGPMGSRGLGQLSYDKGMRVLTSTQADNVALETNLTEQGLLTYTLTREGLEAARADFSPPDGQITVAEWLAFGVNRVPKLFDEVGQRLAEMQAGKGAGVELGQGIQAKLVVFTPTGDALSTSASVAARDGDDARRREMGIVAFAARTQRPSLFDYARRRRGVVLSRKSRAAGSEQ